MPGPAAHGLLHGLPFSAKDLIAMRRRTTTTHVGLARYGQERCRCRCTRRRARQSGGRHSHRQNHNQRRFGLQAGGAIARLTGITRHPWNLQDTGRVERWSGSIGRRRHHAIRARHRRWRLGAHSVLLHRPRRHQSAVRARTGVADLGDTNARPCRPHRPQRRRRGARADGDRRLRPPRSVQRIGRNAGLAWRVPRRRR